MTSTAPSTAPSQTGIARAVNVSKVYGTGEAEVRALDDISVEFATARFTAIMGPSGSGKSTLLHCLAGLDRVTSGHIYLGEIEISGSTEKQLTLIRRDRIGFVFQAYNLIPTLERGGEHHAAAGARGQEAGRGVVPADRGDGGSGRPAQAPSERAFRRPAAAGRGRARARLSSGSDVR